MERNVLFGKDIATGEHAIVSGFSFVVADNYFGIGGAGAGEIDIFVG